MSNDVAILGVGMHPRGKWGRNFTEYGVHAARAALKDAGVAWQDIQFIAGGATMRNGYPGYVAGATDEDFAAIKVKNADHGLTNPNARYRMAFTIEQVFGEAVPAQALAQVCELTWQLRGKADERQIENAKVGITANQDLFGHGSSVIVKR